MFEDFNPSRLTLARQRCGLTKLELAERLEVSTRIVTAWEAGEKPPAEDTIAKIASVTGFPKSFFALPTIDPVDQEGASFRSMKGMTASQRDAALAAGTLAMHLSDWIEANFKLPPPALPDLRPFSEDPERAADALRAHWGLGERPIKSMVHLLEAKGVRVFSLAERNREVDAFSFWRNQTPFVFLNTLKSAERGRFDAAHELGHLVLHRHGGPRGREAEQQADRFASAFLMPSGSVRATVPGMRTLGLPSLLRLTKTWNVSAAALAYRLHTLKILTDWNYRSLCIELSQKGLRTSNGDVSSSAREASMVLQKVFAALREEQLGLADVARELSLPTAEVKQLVFGLVLSGVDGGRQATGASGIRPALRVVDGDAAKT